MVEIERKFLMSEEQFDSIPKYLFNEEDGMFISQGYLQVDQGASFRIRIVTKPKERCPSQAFITIKGQQVGITRDEFEYSIPVEEALASLKRCPNTVEKIRYSIKYNGALWEVDEFLGKNIGLIVAEIELGSEYESIDYPEWIGDEISDDFKYANVNLATNPYHNWSGCSNEQLRFSQPYKDVSSNEK